MQIEVSTDGHIDGGDEVARVVPQKIEEAFGRFAEQITRVEVHLSDTNAAKSGPNDMRCLIEVRVAGRQPMAVSAEASTMDVAIDGAIGKAYRSLHSTLGRLDDHKGRMSFGGDQGI